MSVEKKHGNTNSFDKNCPELNNEHIIYDVRIWNKDEEKFFNAMYKIQYNFERVIIFDGNDKVADVKIPEYTYIDVGLYDLEADKSKMIVKFLDTTFVMKVNDANNIKQYYDDYDNKIDVIMCEKQEEIIKLSNKINDLDNMAINTLNMLEKNIMLNHDAVIAMQTLWAYNKHRDVKILDYETTSPSWVLDIAFIEKCIDSIVEIV